MTRRTSGLMSSPYITWCEIFGDAPAYVSADKMELTGCGMSSTREMPKEGAGATQRGHEGSASESDVLRTGVVARAAW